MTDDEHYAAAVQAWDDAYADRNGLPRHDWGGAVDARGVPVLSDEAKGASLDLGVALLWAKYDPTVNAYLRFWLNAIDADQS